MQPAVERERNKWYYRLSHIPIWIWVFFVLPGDLTYQLYLHGPSRRHWLWLGLVTAVCAWRAAAGRLPGAEPRPYVTHYGAEQSNLWYRVVCYTAAWIDLLVPFTLNFLGLLIAVFTRRWIMAALYAWLYWPLALAIVLATVLNLTPRARRSTRNEGAERGWFYVAIWGVVPAQVAAWAMWRLGPRLGLAGQRLDVARLAAFVLTAGMFLGLAAAGKLGRTARLYVSAEQAVPAATE